MRSFDDEVIDFLVKPENIETAYDIWESFGKARDRLVVDFWKRLIEETEQRLSQAEQSAFWSLVQVDGERGKMARNIRSFLPAGSGHDCQLHRKRDC